MFLFWFSLLCTVIQILYCVYNIYLLRVNSVRKKEIYSDYETYVTKGKAIARLAFHPNPKGLTEIQKKDLELLDIYSNKLTRRELDLLSRVPEEDFV